MRFLGCIAERKEIVMFIQSLLTIPVVTTILASVVFICGGSLHWWMLPCAILVVWCCSSRFLSSKRSSFRLLVGLILFFCVLWLLSGCWVGQSLDEVEYRFPAVRLMMEGWNPVFMSDVGEIERMFGVSLETCRYWHLLFMARGVELFTAVCGMCMNAPLAFSLWLPAFLILPLGFTFFNLPNFSRKIKILMFVCLCALYKSWTEGVVDCVIFLAAVGLLLTMYETLCGNCNTSIALVAYSFWMMVAKQSSLLTCFVFWAIFTVFYLFVCRKDVYVALIRITALGGVLITLFAFTGVSPYFTSWRTHGHPLYPTYVKTGEKSPIDLTADFRIRNEDAEKMGHVALFGNAYISEVIINRFYGWWYDNETFSPYCQTWGQGNSKGLGANAPTNFSDRALIVFSTILAFIFASRKERWIIGVVWMGLFCFPTLYLGYLRYVPWWLTLPTLALGVTLRFIERKAPQLAQTGIYAIILLCFNGVLFRWVPAIDAAWELSPYFYNKRILSLSADNSKHYLNLELLTRQMDALNRTPVVAKNDSRDFLLKQINIAVEEFQEPKCAHLARANVHPQRFVRYISYVSVLFKTYGCSLPALLGQRVRSIL